LIDFYAFPREIVRHCFPVELSGNLTTESGSDVTCFRCTRKGATHIGLQNPEKHLNLYSSLVPSRENEIGYLCFSTDK